MFAATYDANFYPDQFIFLLSDLSVLSDDPSQVTPILILWGTVLTFESFAESVDFQYG
jgi:hypothetical protein